MKKMMFIFMIFLLYINCSGNGEDFSLFISRNYYNIPMDNYVSLAVNTSEYYKKIKENEITEEISLICRKRECIITETVSRNKGKTTDKKEVVKKKLKKEEIKIIEKSISNIKKYNDKIKNEIKKYNNSKEKFKIEETVKFEFYKYVNNVKVFLNSDSSGSLKEKKEQDNKNYQIHYITDDLLKIFEIFRYKHEMLKKTEEITSDDYKNFIYSEKLLTNGNEKEWNLICRELECKILFTDRYNENKFAFKTVKLTSAEKENIVRRIFKGMEGKIGSLKADFYPSFSLYINNGRTYYYSDNYVENTEFYKILDEILGENHKFFE